jgi:hypothetical protein
VAGVRAHYTATRMAERTLEVFRGVIGSASPPRAVFTTA